MSTRLLSPANIIAPLATAAAILATYLFADRLAENEILKGALYLLIAAGAVQTVDGWLIDPLVRRMGMPRLFHTILKFSVGFIVGFTMLKTLYDIDLVPLLTTSAVLSFVLGLALQDTLGNFFAGITINIERPYKVGDWICTADTDGKVVEVTWRTTKLLTRENSYLVVPNNTISKENLVNYSAPGPAAGLWVEVGLEYHIPPNHARDVLLDAVRRMPGLPQIREPEVQVRSFGDSSVNYGVRIWLDDWGKRNKVASEVRTHLWYALHRAGLNIPFPIRTLVQHAEIPKLDTRQAAKDLLSRCALFANLEPPVLDALAAALQESRHAEGEAIVQEGESGDSLYMLHNGSVEVSKAGVQLATLGGGELFGEMSLLTGAPRGATVRAKSDCLCLKLGKDAFARVADAHPQVLSQLGDILATRQLATEQAMQEARASGTGNATELHAQFKTRLMALMKGFLGVRQ